MTPTRWFLASLVLVAATACAHQNGDGEAAATAGASTPAGGQASVRDDESMPDVVKIAVGSKDHTTLVAALKAADLVNALANAGPFTVFAPTDAAFAKLPKGTVEDLVKPENKSTLVNILYHHVTTSALGVDDIAEGDLMMVDGTRAAVTKQGKDMFIGGAKILASVRASNGWVHVIDGVLVPK